MPWDPVTCTYTADRELEDALSFKLTEYKEPDVLAKMHPFRNEHPIPGLKPRAYLGKEPAAYVALRTLKERGRMSQKEFLQVFVDAGSVMAKHRTKKKSVLPPFSMNFNRYIREPAFSKEVEKYEGDPTLYYQELLGKGHAPESAKRSAQYFMKMNAMRVIVVHRPVYIKTGAVRTVKSFGTVYTRPVKKCVEEQAPRGGNMLEWYISASALDWRPEHMIPEDYYSF